MKTTPEITELVSQLPLFKHLDKYELNTLLERADTVRFRHNQLVFREGDVGHSLFIVLSGSVLVFTVNQQKEEVELAQLHSGDYFGEQSLLPNSLGQRNASVRILDDSSLLRISGSDFQSFLAHAPELVDELQQAGEEQIRHKMVQESALFQHFPLDINFPATEDKNFWLQQQVYQDEEVVFHEGEQGDKFYLIFSGVAKVSKTENGQEIVLGRLGEGSFFGELALINQAPRAATITAEGILQVAVLSGEKFITLYKNSPRLREQLEHLSGFYHLPNRGVVTLHAGKFMEMDSITAVYHSNKGASVTTTKVVGKPIFSMHRLNAANRPTTRLVFENSAADTYREIILQDGYVISVMATGAWLDLGRVHELVFNEQKTYFWQHALFREKGELWLAREKQSYADTAIVCRCTGVTRGELNRCVAQGCNRADLLAEKTGASRVCGACMPLLVEIAGRSDMLSCRVSEIKTLSPQVKSFHLTPDTEKTLIPAKIGQHILVEAQINGQWVQRSYTLTSPPQQTAYYEITVKREPRGIFSNWLHDKLTDNSSLRISKPQGDLYSIIHKNTPVIFFAGGIGITPTLSLLHQHRTHNNHEAPIYIDYSAHDKQAHLYQEVLEQAQQDSKTVTTYLRNSKQQGRISEEEVHQITRRYPTAQIFVCGPKTYQNTIIKHLHNAHVADIAVHSEEFIPSGGQLGDMSLGMARFIAGFSFVICLLMAFYFAGMSTTVSAALTNSPPDWWLSVTTDKWLWKQVTGYSSVVLLIGAGLVALRKRIRFAQRLGNYPLWRLWHIIIGGGSLITLALHTQLSWGQGVSALLSFSLFAVIALGIFTTFSLLMSQSHTQQSIATGYQRLHTLHLIFTWSLPMLIILHIFSAYYY